MPTTGRIAPNRTHVQSVLFDKAIWTSAKAKAWLKEHDLVSTNLDETQDKFRFRQYDPNDKFEYRTKPVPKTPGVAFIYGVITTKAVYKVPLPIW